MAASYVLSLNQGESRVVSFTYKTGSPATPVDMTGATAELICRSSINGPVLKRWSTASGHLAISPSLGKVTLTLAPADTLDTAWNAKATYALVITFANGSVKWLATGPLLMRPHA